jgi:hypothetical protein
MSASRGSLSNKSFQRDRDLEERRRYPDRVRDVISIDALAARSAMNKYAAIPMDFPEAHSRLDRGTNRDRQNFIAGSTQFFVISVWKESPVQTAPRLVIINDSSQISCLSFTSALL